MNKQSKHLIIKSIPEHEICDGRSSFTQFRKYVVDIGGCEVTPVLVFHQFSLSRIWVYSGRNKTRHVTGIRYSLDMIIVDTS